MIPARRRAQGTSASRDVLDVGSGTEEDQDAALRELERRVLHPRVSNLIFWPNYEGFDRELTRDEVVDPASAYRPIEL